MNTPYKMVIGLEVHIELKTDSKIFCGCSTAFGAAPNTQCCPVCAGLPGALPVLNARAVALAVKAGLATNCAIAPASRTDRKHYFYPDLPKAYQISQNGQPLCSAGHLTIATQTGEKRIGIARIHMEEDAGKLVHHPQHGTLADLNRCGVPLIEVVSEPELHSAEEAVAYLKKLRSIMLYAEVSDAKMNEGSLRCDVNLSLQKPGSTAFGTRTEIKNLNSFRSVARAIEYEYRRQAQILDGGGVIVQETRRFDAAGGKTHRLRGKQQTASYCFLPEPDLGPILISPAQIEEIRRAIPRLPDERRADYMRRYGLSAYHSEMLVLEKAAADLFEGAAALTAQPQLLASLMLAEMYRLHGENGKDTPIPLTPAQLAEIINLLADGRINSSGAKKLLERVWQSGGQPAELVKTLGLEQLSDEGRLRRLAKAALAKNPAAAADYRAGKTAALQALMGAAMAKTHGSANPVRLRALLLELLEG